MTASNFIHKGCCLLVTLKKEEICSSETSVLFSGTTRGHITENKIIHYYPREEYPRRERSSILHNIIHILANGTNSTVVCLNKRTVLIENNCKSGLSVLEPETYRHSSVEGRRSVQNYLEECRHVRYDAVWLL
jgi:hypothetical protein